MSTQAKVFIGLGVSAILLPFLWHWMTLKRADLVLTVVLLLAAIVVIFECGFRALRDFSGFPHD